METVYTIALFARNFFATIIPRAYCQILAAFQGQSYPDPILVQKGFELISEPDPNNSEPPLFLIQGFHGYARGFYDFIKNIGTAGYKGNIYLIYLPDNDSGPIQDEAARVAKIIDTALKERSGWLTANRDVRLLGHSKGGLVLGYFTEFLAKENNINVKKAITIASPLQGTKTAWFGGSLAYKEMGWHHELPMKVYNSMIANEVTEYHSIGLEYDFIVLPDPETSILANLPEDRK
ncbi:unnamed protein product [marine sediment metagenome]|uniref:DUF676 domain-containing protein n=1 Tax=marine sediment metagenome TaxID=412755 RepID=X0V0V5_9ZZZZ